MRLAVLSYGGCLPSALAIPLDLLIAARTVSALFDEGRFAPEVDVVALSEEGRRLAPSAVAPDACGAPDCVVVPGMFVASEAELGQRLDALGAEINWLAANGASLVASGCTGVFLAAKAGLIGSRTATTTWWLAPKLAEIAPEATLDLGAMVVADGPLITAGAVYSQIDLTLYLIERFGGPELARRVAQYTVLDGRRASQMPYLSPGALAGRDPLLMEIERHVRANPGAASVASAAEACGVAERTLQRRVRAKAGLAPGDFIKKLIMGEAERLLLGTDRSVEEIADLCGYSDAETFRKTFRRYQGQSPTALRRSRGVRRNASRR